MNMPRKKKPTSDAVEIMHRRYYEGRPSRIADLEEARAEDDLARKIYELRGQSGLTQEGLAKLVGTTPSVISRLENSDYQGHSLTMLKRIADALDKRVEFDSPQESQPAARLRKPTRRGCAKNLRPTARGSLVSTQQNKKLK